MLSKGLLTLTAASTLPYALMACYFRQRGGLLNGAGDEHDPWQPAHGWQCYQIEDDGMRPLSEEVIMDKAKGSEANTPPVTVHWLFWPAAIGRRGMLSFSRTRQRRG